MPLLGCAAPKRLPVEHRTPEVHGQLATPTIGANPQLVADDNGTARFPMLSLDGELDAGGADALRSRDGAFEWSWVVRAGVQVTR